MEQDEDRVRADTAGAAARHARVETVLGELLLVAENGVDGSGIGEEPSGDALTGLYFPGHTYPPSADAIGDPVPADAVDEDPVLGAAARQLSEYLAGARRQFDLPIRARGDEFRERVWERLLAIPYGETTTYGALAAELGSRGLAQLVGQAVGHNPISIVIPCHRVVGADGSLTGYAGGKERKQRLLELEEPPEAAASRLF